MKEASCQVCGMVDNIWSVDISQEMIRVTHVLTVQWAVKIGMKYRLSIKTTKSSEKYMSLV
jgi:hypothetical protein